jgi:hypothetical protein
MKNLNKALVASAVFAALSAGNAYAGVEACISVFKGDPVNDANFGTVIPNFQPADCRVNGGALHPGIAGDVGSVAYEVVRDTHINLENTGFDATHGLNVAYVPTSDIPGGSRITVHLHGNSKTSANGDRTEVDGSALFDAANNNQIFLLGREGQVNSTQLRILATSDGVLNDRDTATFIVQSGITIPAGTRLYFSKTNGQITPISIRTKFDSCTTTQTFADIQMSVSRAATDNNQNIEGGVTAENFTILEIAPQHRAYRGNAAGTVGLTAQHGTVDVLTRDFQDTRYWFVDHIQPENYLRNNSTPYAHEAQSGVDVFGRDDDVSLDHTAYDSGLQTCAHNNNVNNLDCTTGAQSGADFRDDYRVTRDNRQRYLDVINEAHFTRVNLDVGVPFSNQHRVQSTFATEHHRSHGAERIGMYESYNAAAAPTKEERNYFSDAIRFQPTGSYLANLNQMYPLPFNALFDQSGTRNFFLALTPDRTLSNDARRLNFNFGVDVNYQIVFSDNIGLQGQSDTNVNYNNHCTGVEPTHVVSTNGALLKAPYAVSGPGNFIRVTNEATHVGHVVAEIFGESADGTTGNRHVQDVYLGTVPAKSSVVFNVTDIVRAAQEQKGYSGADGGYSTNSQQGFHANLTDAGKAKPISAGYNQQAAGNRHTVTLTVTTEQNKAHAVTVQRIPGGVDRVMPIFKPTKELVYGQDGEPKLTFSWQQ